MRIRSVLQQLAELREDGNMQNALTILNFDVPENDQFSIDVVTAVLDRLQRIIASGSLKVHRKGVAFARFVSELRKAGVTSIISLLEDGKTYQIESQGQKAVLPRLTWGALKETIIMFATPEASKKAIDEIDRALAEMMLAKAEPKSEFSDGDMPVPPAGEAPTQSGEELPL